MGALRGSGACVSTAASRPWVAVGRPAALKVLARLADAHAHRGPIRLVAVTDAGAWRSAIAGARSVLVVGNPRRGPRSALPGLVVDDHGRPVPVGWLPDDCRLDVAVAAMTVVAARPSSSSPLLLFCDRVARSTALLGELQSVLIDRLPVHRWDAERVARHTLLEALGAGAGAALYSGCATPKGWLAYGGVRGCDLAARPEPIGILLSLTCHTASRHRVGRSFAEQALAAGAAGAVLAATRAVRHKDNVAFAHALVAAVARGITSIGDLVCAPGVPATCRRLYRLVGDPGARLVGAAGSVAACAAVPAPAPTEAPPPLPAGWWPTTGEGRENTMS